MTIQLPTKKIKPELKVEDLKLFIYGREKIGKSTFCSEADTAVFLATERGLDHLETYSIPISKWQDLKDAIVLLKKGEHKFKTIVIDTVDEAWFMCEQHILNEYKATDLRDGKANLGYGRGDSLVEHEFHKVLNYMSRLPYGLIFVSHDITRTVDEVLMTAPSLHKNGRKIIEAWASYILYFDVFDKDTRIIRTRASKNLICGGRIANLPAKLPLSYKAFKEAVLTANKINNKPADKQNPPPTPTVANQKTQPNQPNQSKKSS